MKILFTYCNRYTYEYIPHRDQSLAFGIRDVNKLGPAKFQNGAGDDKEQVCYFKYNKKDRVFNRLLAVRKEHLIEK